MKKLAIAVFTLLSLISCSSEKSNFEQVGYHKSESKLRYITFQIKDSMKSTYENISVELALKIKEHGSRQMNSSGKATASFYYLTPQIAPDITTLNSQRANDVAHANKPLMVVWITPSGKVNIINKPK